MQKWHDVIPVFFCENCGTEVPEGDDTCFRCNKRFFGVKCPRCFYEGKDNSFEKGCPQCHFIPGQKEQTLNEKQVKQTSVKINVRPSSTRVLSGMTVVGAIFVALILVFLLYMI